jgi:predicted subunit of tRNA(5-methylaminomethyl-2-thiouridylate) methyltransferase
MDPLGALGFAGTLLTLIDFTLRFSHHLEKVKLELEQQQSEYDVIRLVLQEAVNAVVSDGSPTQAIQSAMLLCAKLDKDLEREFQRVLFLLEKHDHKRMLRLVRVFSRRNDRRFAYEAFRDSVLLLRDLSYR